MRSWISAITQMVLILVIIALLVGVALPALKAKGFEETIEKNFAHVEKRLDTFLNPESASADDTYQIDQSVIAMGSGGLSGVGLGSGRQKYNYLPEPYNDFIFAVIGEELGFIGTLSVILLFVLFLLMGVGITYRAPNAFGAVLVGGYTMLISIQAFFNIAVALRPSQNSDFAAFIQLRRYQSVFLLAIGFILLFQTGHLQGQEFAERSLSATLRLVGGRP